MSSLPSITQLSSNPVLSSAAKSAANSSGAASASASERLFLVRPRSARVSDDQTSTPYNDRGKWGYLKLLGYSGQGSSTAGMSKQVSSIYQESMNTLTSKQGPGYDKFLITSVSSSLDEKVQVVEVFGDSEVAYYFGRHPITFNVTGMLIDSPDNSWFTDFLVTYNDILRGSKLAQNREKIQLVMPNMTLQGSITNLSWQQDASNDVAIPFRMTLFVTDLIPTPPLVINSAITDAAQYLDFRNVANFTSQSQISKVKAYIDILQDPSSSTANKTAAMTGLSQTRNSTINLPLQSNSLGDGWLNSANGAINNTASSINSAANWISSEINSVLDPSSPLGNISSDLSTIRAGLFLPVYGVMNSLTKLVGSVFGSNGIASVLSKLTAPVRNILGDITRFANQATAIANMIVSGTGALGRGISTGFGITTSYTQAAQAVSGAAGTFASLPGNVGSSVQGLFSSGFIPSSSAFLKLSPKATLSRTPTLSLGAASLSSLSPQLSILSRGPTTIKGAYI